MTESDGTALRLRYDQAPAERGFVPSLNGLRALSIGIVLLGHFFMGESGGFSSLGVYIFFAISGFLITRLAFAEVKTTGRFDVPAFFLRRVARLYPVLIVNVIVITLIAALRNEPVSGVQVASVFGYFVNYLHSWYEYWGIEPPLPFGTLWSLAVEEHFYLLFPLAFVAFAGKSRRILWFAIALCVIPFLIRIGYLIAFPEFLGTNIIYRLSETRFDSIATGVLLAALCEGRKAETVVRAISSRKAMALGGLLLLLSYVIRDPVFKDTIRYTLRNAACFALVAFAVFGRHATWVQRLLNLRFADWIGRISYSLYIWHGAMSWVLKPWWVGHGMLFGMAQLAMTFSCAVVSYYSVELPALRWKKAYTDRRKARMKMA